MDAMRAEESDAALSCSRFTSATRFQMAHSSRTFRISHGARWSLFHWARGSLFRWARGSLSGVSLWGALAACGNASSEPVALSHAEQPIFGGGVDTEHPEVMLLASQRGFLCSGTVVATDGPIGFLLTAAHCVTEEDGTALPADDFVVVPGEDFAESTSAFAALSVSVEPSYDGSFAANDVAVVGFFAEDAALGHIPALGAAEDELAIGDDLLLVGYGQTELDGDNTRRRSVSRSLEDLDEQLLVYSQQDARGACFGDSGGPVLV